MRREKIDAIKALAEIRTINQGDVERMIEIQDTVNCTMNEAMMVCRELDPQGRRVLMWVITTACGYDTFQFWLDAIGRIAYEKVLEQVNKEVAERNRERWQELENMRDDLCKRVEEVAMREAVARGKEESLAIKEQWWRVEVERKVGVKIRLLRGQIAKLQAELKEAKEQARKLRIISKLV
jgi:hypothetical protein